MVFLFKISIKLLNLTFNSVIKSENPVIFTEKFKNSKKSPILGYFSTEQLSIIKNKTVTISKQMYISCL